MVLAAHARAGVRSHKVPWNLPSRWDLLPTTVLVLWFSRARAEEPRAADPSDNNPSATALAQAAALARRFEVHLADPPGDKGIVPPIERPLLLFGDDPRNLTRGILWGWGSGRPLAVAELWRGRAENAPYAVSLTFTGQDSLGLHSDGARKWEPARPQIEFVPLANAPPPAAKDTLRLRQLKEIARRFTAHEFWDPDNSRFELRLLVQPVHRYSDPKAEIQDGALFVFAHGTNPEALLLVEAVGPTVDKAKWQFGWVRTSNAETHAELDSKEVWTQPRVKGGSTRPADPYFVFSLPAAEAATDPPAKEPKTP
jgi:hypothetical protein